MKMISYRDTEGEEYVEVENGVLGRGGFGTVYLVKRKSDQKKFAVKTIDAISNEDNLMSIKNEMKMALKIFSDNVIKYIYFHDGETFENFHPYIIMEYAADGTLQELLQERKNKNLIFSNNELKNIFLQLSNGMKDISECGIIHRDIKPVNILISEGELKITDFGLSKVKDEMTRIETFKGAGTERYASPEVWRYEKNRIQIDMYSMGIIFYELATLNYPYDVGKISSYEDAHIFENIIPPKKNNPRLPTSFIILIEKMLSKRPSDRYEDWDEIIKIIENSNIEENEIKNDKMIENALEQTYKTQSKKNKEENRRRVEEEKRKSFYKMAHKTLEREVLDEIDRFIEKYKEKGGEESLLFNKPLLNYLEPHYNFKVEYHGEVIVEGSFEIIEGLKFSKIVINHRNVDTDYNGVSSSIESRQIPDIPKYKDKTILAWGEICHKKYGMHQGYNLFLLEDEDNSYGKLHVIKVTSKPGRLVSHKFDLEVEKMGLDNAFSLVELFVYFKNVQKNGVKYTLHEEVYTPDHLFGFITRFL